MDLGGLDCRTALATLWEMQGAALLLADAQGLVLAASAGVEALLGHPRAELEGRDLSELIHGDQRAAHRRAFGHAVASGEAGGASVRRHGLAQHREGRLLPVEVDVRPVELTSGQGWLAAIRARSVEPLGPGSDAQLLTAQRMELLGELASGVAHDLNNLLTPILASAELLEGAVQGLEARSDLRAISHAAQSGRQLLRQLLLFAGRQETRPEVAAPADVGRRVVEIMRHALPAGVRLELSVADALPATRVDPVQLEQVLLNLVGNAVHACRDGGGRVHIRLGAAQLAADAPGGRAGRYLRVCVEDDGPGVPEALRARIFDPFFTTKPAGVGTGLGLAVSRGIAARHGGELRLEAREVGACFSLYLPAAEAARPSSAPPPERPTPAELGLRCALVLDDDEVALRALSRLVERLGLEVRAFVDPAEALAWLASDGASLDVALTDGLMPTMTGREFAEATRRLRPALPIVLVSGLGRGADDVEGRFDSVLAKPFTRGELRQALAAAVAARRGRR